MALTKIEASNIADDAVDIPQLGATGTADATTFLRGDNAWTAIASAGFNSCQFFDATDTWTKPAGVTKVIVFVTGGGGGSGGGDSNGRAGGGAATIIKTITSGLGATEAVTVGAGGTAGGTGGGGSAGGAGGTTSFGSHCSAGGGPGGGGAYGQGSQTTSGAVANVDFSIGGSDGGDHNGGGSFWGGGTSTLTAHVYGTSPKSLGGSGSGAGKQGLVWVLEFK